MSQPAATKLALARGLGQVARLGGSGGTSAPGRLLMWLAPEAIAQLGARLAQGSALVSATNGKTTTATMTARILERAGVSLVHNSAGANMAGGIATTLLQAARPRGAIAGQLGLFEVDELWLVPLVQQLRPRAILLANLFRDQLDRYGELETIAERWAQTLQARPPRRLVLNADDPLVADLGRDQSGVLYFGVQDDTLALPGMAHAADAKHCRRCGAPYRFDVVYMGHLGHYHCPSCGQRRPQPDVSVHDVRLQGVHGARFTLRAPAGEAEIALGLPGLYNVYNALAAASLALALGASLEHVVAGLADARAAFGRGELVRLSRAGADARDMRILLVKNPAGANEVLRTLVLEPGEHDLLAVLNDQIADGRDVSWIWDADFELLAGRVRRATCSGSRAADLAARLKYAGVEPERIVVHEQLAQALDQAAADRGQGADGRPAALYALPTYTAMLALRELLHARGEVTSPWS